jgi:hypothetical protein
VDAFRRRPVRHCAHDVPFFLWSATPLLTTLHRAGLPAYDESRY